jgi:hypothetical protein
MLRSTAGGLYPRGHRDPATKQEVLGVRRIHIRVHTLPLQESALVLESPFSERRLVQLRERYSPTSLDKAQLFADRYCLARCERYSVYFAPIATFPSPKARVILVGLTPGESQARKAAAAYFESTPRVRDDPQAWSAIIRRHVAFAGAMRANLCSMLDELDFPRYLGARRTSELFERGSSEIATTSALLYPVFVGPELRNFSGDGISLANVLLFRRMLDELLAPRLASAPDAMIIPLGRAAASGIRYLCENRIVSRERVLLGMPHPSGANGHRRRQFAEGRDAMATSLRQWFERL